MIRHLFAASALSLCLPAPAFAADAENGRTLARQCSVCHGKTGMSKDPEVPNIAGQSALYLEKTMKDYREGRREDRRMTLIAQPLSDEEISDLAAWYSSIEVTVVVPE